MPRIKVEVTVYDTRLHFPSDVRESFFYSLSLFFHKALEKYTNYAGKVIFDITYKLSQVDDDETTLSVWEGKEKK